jgi:dTDP-4-amino-4,6-dideoxygalactose transaminase
MANQIPVFADADPETLNVSPAAIAERVTDRTRAIIVGHIAGQPADMDPIMKLAARHKLVVIEDCSQAHGAYYQGRRAGSIGHAAAFSLMSGKHTTAGGQGGMVVTDDEELYWNAKRFADRGKPFNSDAPGNIFLGLNYRMTELQAAIGRAQLRRMDEIARRRRRFVREVSRRIRKLVSVGPGTVIEGAKSSYWFWPLRVDASQLAVTKDEFAAAVRAEGVPFNASYSHIVPDQPWIANRAAYGRSGCPWTCPSYGREISYADGLPGARKAVADHAILPVQECCGVREAEDVAAALAKVEAAYLK